MLIIRLIRLSVLELQPLTTMVIFKSTRLYDKKDDFSFVIIHFPPLDNNIPATPEYGNYITFEPAVLIQSFNNITVFFLLNYYSHLIFQMVFRKVSTPYWKVFSQLHTDDKRLCWLKVDNNFPIISFDRLLCDWCLTFRWRRMPPCLVCRTSIR